jgi:hypothetical protein
VDAGNRMKLVRDAFLYRPDSIYISHCDRSLWQLYIEPERYSVWSK